MDTHQQFVTIDKIPDDRGDVDKLSSTLALYDHDSPDIAYAERQAEEIINLSGAWVTVFKRTKNHGNQDDVFDEDADPTYMTGIKLKGLFAPQPMQAQLTRFGVDAQNDTTIHFCRATVWKLFGNQMISEGDVIIVPHNTLSVIQDPDLRSGPSIVDRFRVINSSDSGCYRYRWLYWDCLVQSITSRVDVEFSKEKA